MRDQCFELIERTSEVQLRGFGVLTDVAAVSTAGNRGDYAGLVQTQATAS